MLNILVGDVGALTKPTRRIHCITRPRKIKPFQIDLDSLLNFIIDGFCGSCRFSFFLLKGLTLLQIGVGLRVDSLALVHFAVLLVRMRLHEFIMMISCFFALARVHLVQGEVCYLGLVEFLHLVRGDVVFVLTVLVARSLFLDVAVVGREYWDDELCLSGFCF